MTITPTLEHLNHQAPVSQHGPALEPHPGAGPTRHALPEVELLRIKVAQLSVEVAQMQTQRLAADCNDLIRQTLLRYVSAADVEDYAIDLGAGLIVPRQEGAN